MRIIRTMTLPLALAFAVTIAAPVSPAAAQSSQQVSKPTKKIVKRPARSAPRQIACTAFGCHPIPPNCRPQTGYRWDGIPSGFDVVVCR
ncbi:hypothetical protein [Undibacter mobilis]|uniref:Uncharacterized protein n=1 Tax=Undibacter mobilis TaxID=2292256 RepID=A0A371BD37_9BRAD|nr:hypothetical protein [Undibacter mobilis]RDV05519.1 hypothetical protein DXH78_13620 [Undibacter mobilis]